MLSIWQNPRLNKSPQGPCTRQHWPFPPRQPNETRKPGCPRWEIFPQWCCIVVPGWQGQASCPERTLWALSNVEFDWDPDSLTEVKSSVWKRTFSEALVWAPYWSWRFWKPSPKSFVQDVPGKTCMGMTWWSSLTRWSNYNRSWSSGRLTWKERDFG